MSLRPSVLLATSVATNKRQTRDIEFVVDNEINALAKRVAHSFKDNPLMGVDILRDESTGMLYVLELNLGGNVWHFSSNQGAGGREDLGGRDAYVGQYNAFDKAATALVIKTYELAV